MSIIIWSANVLYPKVQKRVYMSVDSKDKIAVQLFPIISNWYKNDENNTQIDKKGMENDEESRILRSKAVEDDDGF